MAATNALKEVGNKLVSQIFSGAIWIGGALIIIAVLLGVIYYFFVYQRKFDIKVKVISERAGDKHKIIFDKAAILRDRKTKNKFIRVWNLKVDLPLPKFNIFQISNEGDFIEIYRTSEDQFYYLTPPRVDKDHVIKLDGKLYPILAPEYKQIDTDIAYWNVKRKDMNKRMFDTESLLMKLLPYLGILLGGVIIIFVLYILLDHLPGILTQLQDLTRELSRVHSAEVIPA